MKKALLTLAASFLLLFSIQSAAYAEEYYNLGTYTAGTYIDSYICDVDGSAFIQSDALPDGCEIVDEVYADSRSISLRGTPAYAGRYDFLISVFSSTNYMIVCSVNIEPATPTVTACPPVECEPDANTMLYVTASTSDGGSLSYQWFLGSGANAIPIVGEVSPTYFPDTSAPGTSYYSCVVVNNNNGLVSSVTSASISVKVKERGIKSVEIASLPTKTTYFVGEQLDLKGLIIRVNAGNDSIFLDTGYTASPMLLTTAGSQTIRIDFGGKSCFFKVNVRDASAGVDGIGVVTLPSKTKYKVGESLNTAGLSIRAYVGNSHFDVSNGLECTPMIFNKAGTQSVTVKYGGKTCTFSVTVEELKEQIRSVTLANKPYRLEYSVGDTLDSTGLSLRVVTNQKTSDVTSGFTCTPKVLNTPGTQTITVYYDQYSCTFDVKVLPKSTPTPVPTVAPQAVPSPEPSPSSFVSPTPQQGNSQTRPEQSYKPDNINRSNSSTGLVKVGLIIALVAMVGIVGCVYLLNSRKDIDLSKLFNSRRKH